MGHFPYGEPWYNATNDKLLFTTYERDSDSSNDYAMARYHINRFGRFSSPDPLDGSIDSAETGAHLALEGAAASSVFKRAIRTRIGVPMSTTSKILGRVTVALFLYSGYEALKAAQDEYQACMNY